LSLGKPEHFRGHNLGKSKKIKQTFPDEIFEKEEEKCKRLQLLKMGKKAL